MGTGVAKIVTRNKWNRDLLKNYQKKQIQPKPLLQEEGAWQI